MKAASRKSLVVASVLSATGALVPGAAQAAVTAPKITRTQVLQSGSQMSVFVDFEASKTDRGYPITATICVVSHCKSIAIAKLTAPQATLITPNVTLRLNELGRRVKVTTTLAIDGKRYRYISNARDNKFTGG